MIRNGEGALEAAAGRLSRAVETLEQRLQAMRSPAEPAEADEALRADLRSARERERALESAAAEASATLGRAAEQIRAAMRDEGGLETAPDEAEAAFEPDDGADLDDLSDDQTDLHQTGFRFRNGEG